MLFFILLYLENCVLALKYRIVLLSQNFASEPNSYFNLSGYYLLFLKPNYIPCFESSRHQMTPSRNRRAVFL
jgi:hypothetical protein